MILFVGQVASDQRDREAFQEVDYRQMFAPLAKWVAQIDRTDRIPEYVSHAFHIAQSGRPGPVVLALPEDMLSATADVADAPAANVAAQLIPDQAVQTVIDQIASAKSPMMIVGGPAWSVQAARDLADFATQTGIPVGTSFRCQDYIDNRHPNYIGDVGIGPNPALAQRVRDADVLVVLGARMGEMTTGGYDLLSIPKPAQTLIHIHQNPDEIGRVYHADLALSCSAASFLAAAVRLTSGQKGAGPEKERAAYEA